MQPGTFLHSRGRSHGLSLVEILVGVAIGLIGTVAIFQAVAVWSKHTATTTSGGDAQVAGTLALFNIERDVKQAGHGFGRAGTPVMGCNVAATDTTPARAFNFPLQAVAIAASAGGAPDTVNILYGNSSFYVEEGAFTDATATTKKLVRRGGFKQGDLAVIAVNPGASAAGATCQLIQVTDDTNADGYTIAHTNTPFVSFYGAASSPAVASRFNTAVAPGAVAGTIYNLGPDPRLDVWSIQNNRFLTRTDVIHATAPMQIAEGVINLKAEYGVDADSNGTISPGEWQTAAPADWRQRARDPRRRPGAQPPVRAQPRRRRGERSERGHADGGQSVLLRRPGAHLPDDQRRRHGGLVHRHRRQPEQLALLPLPRLRTRHPVAQHALGELGMKSRCRAGPARRVASAASSCSSP